MASDATKQQARLMKKRQKDKTRKQKQQQNIPFGMLSARKKITMARDFPFHDSLINPSWLVKGMATILVSRLQPAFRGLFSGHLLPGS